VLSEGGRRDDCRNLCVCVCVVIWWYVECGWGVSLPWGKEKRLDAEVMRVQGVLKFLYADRHTHTHTHFTLTQTCKVMLLPRFRYACKHLYHSPACLFSVMTNNINSFFFLHCQVFMMSRFYKLREFCCACKHWYWRQTVSKFTLPFKRLGSSQDITFTMFFE